MCDEKSNPNEIGIHETSSVFTASKLHENARPCGSFQTSLCPGVCSLLHLPDDGPATCCTIPVVGSGSVASNLTRLGVCSCGSIQCDGQFTCLYPLFVSCRLARFGNLLRARPTVASTRLAHCCLEFHGHFWWLAIDKRSESGDIEATEFPIALAVPG